jgi:hypothetical protein
VAHFQQPIRQEVVPPMEDSKIAAEAEAATDKFSRLP